MVGNTDYRSAQGELEVTNEQSLLKSDDGSKPALSTSPMSRRNFVGAALGTAAAGGLLAACGGGGASSGDEALSAGDLPTVEWDMPTSWPITSIPWAGAQFFVDQVSALTGGRFKITPFPSGEVVPGLEVLPNIQTGAIVSGHSSSYYYTGADPVLQIATAMPFGMTARQHQSWMLEGGGLELFRDIYRERFDMVHIPAGNTGCQMGGWFKKEIKSVSDLSGLRMRIGGMGGEALERLGATVQVLSGGEIYQSLETGALDAAEWVGPYDDLEQEFNKVANFYYYPGWWEPGPTQDFMVSAKAWDDLPEEYQAALEAAGWYAYNWVLSRYDTLNPPALTQIKEDPDIVLAPFPDEVLDAAAEEVDDIVAGYSAADETYKTVIDSYYSFRDGVGEWHGLAEKSLLDYLAR